MNPSRITISHSGKLSGNPEPNAIQLSSVVINGAIPNAAQITNLEITPIANDFMLTFEADPGAYFTVQTSDTLQTGSWTDVVSVLAEDTSNTMIVTAPVGQAKKFWRMRRGQ